MDLAPSLARRIVSLGTAAALTMSLAASLLSPSAASAAATPTIRRVAGTDRYATSVAISRQTFTSADTVIVTTGLGYPDALAAAPLAGALGAPILLVPGTSLPAAVSAEVTRLGATKAIIPGSSLAVGTAVENALKAKGLTVERIEGVNRYATASALAARAATAAGRTTGGTVFVARGNDFADALSVSPAAYSQRFPVLLTLPSSVPADTLARLRALAPARIVIAGGTAAVSSGVEATLKTVTSNVTRVQGANRYATSAAFADYAIGQGWLNATNVGFASGVNFPDALGAGAALGKTGNVLVLTSNTSLVREAGTFLRYRSAETSFVTLFGGLPALNSGVESGVRMVYNPKWIGYYVPGAPASLSSLTALENTVGRQAAVSLFFQSSAQGFPTTPITNATNHGSIPMVTWEFWNGGGTTDSAHQLADINSGAWDSYFHTYARNAKAFGKEIYFRPMHEMNGNWYPWCGTVNGNSPAAYGSAWRRIRGIFTAEGATNVKFVWAPNVDSVPNTSANEIRDYWPGEAYVDIIGLDGYNFGGSSWRSFSSTFGSSYSQVAALSASKPIIIAEMACGTDGGDKAAWIADMFNVLPSQFPRIVGITWFNANKERDWRIESNSASLTSFRSGMGRF